MKTQAWGWLAAAVVAAGLNASYHDGGLHWAHQVVDQVKHNSSAVIALATGRADQFLVEANLASPRPQASPCPLALLAEAHTMVIPKDFELQRVELISAREQAQLARVEARRARIEAKLAQVHIPAMAFNPVVVQAPKVICPHVRVHMPRIPAVKMPALPVVHLQNTGFGSV
jgi:hypothetical protein